MRQMNSFRATLEELEVKKLQLHGHRFTWTSGTTNPTQIKMLDKHPCQFVFLFHYLVFFLIE
jgi:hypothetical protein